MSSSEERIRLVNEEDGSRSPGTGNGGGDADSAKPGMNVYVHDFSSLEEPGSSQGTPFYLSEEEALAAKASSVKEHDVPEEESAAAEKVKSEIDKELEENDGWLKILGNDEIMKKVIKPGVPETRPLRGEICTVRIEGKLESDESVVFESEESFKFQLGDVEVITGLDMSIPLMCKGEVALVKVSSRFGYGAKGCPPKVPPNARLVYEIELLDFKTEKDLVELTAAERRKIGNKKRERGNWWYTRGEVSLAIQSYRRALEFLDEAEGGIQYPSSSEEPVSISDELKQLFEDRIKTLNNMAQAQLKLKAYEPALSSVESVLKCQPRNVKALFRKGKILGEKGSTEAALKVLHIASDLEPDNKAIQQEIALLNQRQKKEHLSEKLLYKRMFKDSTDKSPSSKTTSKSGSYKSALTVGLVLTGVAVAAAGVFTYRYRLV